MHLIYTFIFKYVVEVLEGKGDDVIKRQNELRALVKGVIPCDILSDPILIVPGYEGPYDVIISICCLPSARQLTASKVLTKLLKN